MSKETKSAKQEMKAQKQAAKLEKQQAKQYAKYVKAVEKDNAKLEKKANKKGKPFVPVAIPSQEELFASVEPDKTKHKIKFVVLLILVLYIIYFLIMWFNFNPISFDKDDKSDLPVYDRYENPHEITTAPNYDIATCKEALKQTIKDNYGAGAASSAINSTGNTKQVNNQDCYEFTNSGKTFLVARNLSAFYVVDNGEYKPLTFHGTEFIFD